MFRLVSTLAIVLSSISSTSAFSVTTIRAKIAARSSATVMKYHQHQEPSVELDLDPRAVNRALDCANNYGMCAIDELLDLSEELDEYLGCYVDNGPEECEREIDNRQGLSEALLVQGEMREHDRYVQEGNVFPFDANTPPNSQTMNGSDNMNPRTSVWREEDEFFMGDPTLHP